MEKDKDNVISPKNLLSFFQFSMNRIFCFYTRESLFAKLYVVTIKIPSCSF